MCIRDSSYSRTEYERPHPCLLCPAPLLRHLPVRANYVPTLPKVPASPQHAVDMVSIRNPRIDVRPASLPRHPSKKLQEGKRLCRRSRTLRDYLRTATRGDFTFEMQRSSKRERWPASLAAVRETSRLLSFCWPTPRPLPCSSLDPRALVSRHAARSLALAAATHPSARLSASSGRYFRTRPSR